jgi:hypothetical protein
MKPLIPGSVSRSSSLMLFSFSFLPLLTDSSSRCSSSSLSSHSLGETVSDGMKKRGGFWFCSTVKAVSQRERRSTNAASVSQALSFQTLISLSFHSLSYPSLVCTPAVAVPESRLWCSKQQKERKERGNIRELLLLLSTSTLYSPFSGPSLTLIHQRPVPSS